MPRRSHAPERLLTTVMFTDIVASTQLAAKLGDRGWRQLLSRHHSFVRKVLKRHGGREVDTAGDGFFATFDQPAKAVRCATELVEGLHRLGIEIRAGIHMGEVEVIGPKVGGIAVHIGSRVMSKAEPGEVLVSGTVRDLMAGSELRFEDRGVQELKGVPAQWHLFAVEAAAATPERVEPAPLGAEPAGRRSTAPLILVAGTVVVAIVAAVAVVATRGGGGAAAFVPAPNTVARIDPVSGKVVGGTAVGTTPISIAFGEGSVWVANFGARTVQRIDPTTNQAGPAFGGLNGNPTGMAVGGGFAWVTSRFIGTVSQIDPTNNIVKPIDVGVGVKGVAFGEGSVWVTNPIKGTVLRIEPRTGLFRTIELPAGSAPDGIVVGGGWVWVADTIGARVLRIDPGSNKVAGSGTPIRGQPAQMAFGAGYVWVTDTSADSVTRIDPATAEGVTIEQVGKGPTGIAAGAGGVWVANKTDGTIVQIDPRSAKVVRRIRIGFSPDGVTEGGGAVWVTVHSSP